MNNEQATTIRFGTSGWRALIAREFTFDNVRLVTQAIADVIKPQTRSPRIVVGYDTRFLSAEFARCCAQVLAANTIDVVLSGRDVPTPVIAYHIIAQKLSGGINFTASHNPPEYNGIKFSPAYGGPAPKQLTTAIEEKIAQLQIARAAVRVGAESRRIVETDLRPEYWQRLLELVDSRAIRRAKLRLAVDMLYGTGRDYLDTLLHKCGVRPVVLHAQPNPCFGGRPPEPDKPYIPELIALVRKQRLDLGLACDGDADRFGIVDRGGFFFSPNEIFSLLFYYLTKQREPAPLVARSLATTHMIDAIARQSNMEVLETPVGFKYIGEALSRGDCLIGGEESGGLSIQGHVPEKDGILACLLVAEMVAREKKSLRVLLAELRRKFGGYYSGRINIPLPADGQAAALKRINAARQTKTFGGLAVARRDLRDGVKLVFADNHWIMFRLSGTEPVARCYLEAPTPKQLRGLQAAAMRFVTGDGLM